MAHARPTACGSRRAGIDTEKKNYPFSFFSVFIVGEFFDFYFFPP